MPKLYSFPVIFDEVPAITIGELNKRGFFRPGFNIGSISWGNQSIKVVGVIDDNPGLVLDYNLNGQHVRDCVKLTSTRSNLNDSKIYWFTCPATRVKCKKLYLLDGHFVHRTANPKGMYRIQARPSKYREWEKTVGAYLDAEKARDDVNGKNFVKYRSGKPTKRYRKLLAIIEKAEGITSQDVMNWY